MFFGDWFYARAVRAVIRHYSDYLKLKVSYIVLWLLLLSQPYCLVTTSFPVMATC